MEERKYSEISLALNKQLLKGYGDNITSEDPIIRNYIQKRKYTEETIKKYHLGYVSAGALNSLAGRVVYPWIDVNGNVLGFCGRHINNRQAGIFDKFEYTVGLQDCLDYELWGLYQATEPIKQNDCVYVVAGYSDVLSFSQCGIKNVISSSGRSLTAEHAKLIHCYTDNVILVCESTQESLCYTEVLKSEGLKVRVVSLSEFEDADTLANRSSHTELKTYLETNAIEQ